METIDQENDSRRNEETDSLAKFDLQDACAFLDSPKEIKHAILDILFCAKSHHSTNEKEDLKLRTKTAKSLILVCKEFFNFVESKGDFWKIIIQTNFRIVRLESLPPDLMKDERFLKSRQFKFIIHLGLISRFEVNTKTQKTAGGDNILNFPVVEAIKENKKDQVINLLSTIPVNINEAFCDSFTLLHHAINVKHHDIAVLLLEKGFTNVNAMDIRGETPLHRAAWNNQKGVAEELLKKGAQIESRNFFGYSPLHLAAANGKIEVVKFLLEQSANINSRSNVGNTPLHRAQCRGHYDIVKLLIERGANIDMKNEHGKSYREYTKVYRKNHQLDFQ